MELFAKPVTHQLDSNYQLIERRLPPELTVSDAEFDQLWDLHPDEFHEIVMHGKLVKTPRWQQAYERDYKYTGCATTPFPCPPPSPRF